MFIINAWLGPFSIEATEAVTVDIILKFLVYLAKNISLRGYILKKTNHLAFFLSFLRKDIGPAGDYMYGLSTHIHTELKHFIDRLSMSYVLYNKSGIDNT